MIRRDDTTFVGRNEQLELIRSAMARMFIPNGPAEAIFLSGPSGTGKTTLIQTIRRQQNQNSLFWACGKYEQTVKKGGGGRHPYSAFLGAFAGLCSEILHAKDQSIINDIQDRLCAFFSVEELRVLVVFLPAISGLAGDLLEETASSTTCEDEDENETNVSGNEESWNIAPTKFTFRLFIGLLRRLLLTLSSDQYPIVMFLDDLQSADPGSLDLLSILLSGPGLSNFLFIGAYRSEDESTFDIAALTARANIKVQFLKLDPLSALETTELVARCLDVNVSNALDLGKMIFDHTSGNALFSIQTLEMLQRKKMITIVEGTVSWEPTKVQDQLNPQVQAEGVLLLFAEKSALISKRAQLALTIASVIGFTFNKKVLRAVLDSTRLDDIFSADMLSCHAHQTSDFSADVVRSICLKMALSDAMKMGLVECLSNDSYKFVHDKVQQWFLDFIPVGETGRKLKSRIGHSILGLYRTNDALREDWMLFSATSLFLRYEEGHDELVASLCIEAATAALRKSAFRSASKYADTGYMRLRDRDGWNRYYDLSLKLCILSVEIHFSIGSLTSSLDMIAELDTHAVRTNEDVIQALKTKVLVLSSTRQPNPAIPETIYDV